MAAADPNAQSISWAASASLGRRCGSIWASAVLPALLEESTSNSTEAVEEILPAETLMRINERLLVPSADRYSNICSRKLIVRLPNTTLPSVPKMMNVAWYGPT